MCIASKLNIKKLSLSANTARGLAMDAISAAQSGHLGLPLGAAEIGAVLFGKILSINPDRPNWINRDRFVLSAGHGSMFLYGWLHLSGFDISIKDIKCFRKLNSVTPGHPEFGETSGIEATTGPLGQGVGNAVGMAMAQKMSEKKFNRDNYKIFDHHVICLLGDGCMQEGVSSESCAFAGHNELDNLILIYDNNNVTLGGESKKSQSEDTFSRFKSYGFDVMIINGHNISSIALSIENAKNNNNKKPKLIICNTVIGFGIPEVAGKSKAHGEYGIRYIDSARKGLNLPEEAFFVEKKVGEYFLDKKRIWNNQYRDWIKTFKEWQSEFPDLNKKLTQGLVYYTPNDLSSSIEGFVSGVATRSAAGKILQNISKRMTLIVSGSADLHESTKNYIKDGGDFNYSNRGGRNIHWGIREHAMGAMMNGVAYYGIFRISGATFLTFSDYMRPAIRIAALAKLPIFYIFTHDSIGVGEDGPTHEPIETINSLRLIPNLDVIRPGDAEETTGAVISAINRIDGPTAIILSRQDIPIQNSILLNNRRLGSMRGGYIAIKEKGELRVVIISTGSELQHAVIAAKELGDHVRVVSMPCLERFDRQSKDYRENVIPCEIDNIVSIEAGTTGLWYKYVGKRGKVIGVDKFGLSGPGVQIMSKYKITSESLIKVIKKFTNSKN